MGQPFLFYESVNHNLSLQEIIISDQFRFLKLHMHHDDFTCLLLQDAFSGLYFYVPYKILLLPYHREFFKQLQVY